MNWSLNNINICDCISPVCLSVQKCDLQKMCLWAQGQKQRKIIFHRVLKVSQGRQTWHIGGSGVWEPLGCYDVNHHYLKKWEKSASLGDLVRKKNMVSPGTPGKKSFRCKAPAAALYCFSRRNGFLCITKDALICVCVLCFQFPYFKFSRPLISLVI